MYSPQSRISLVRKIGWQVLAVLLGLAVSWNGLAALDFFISREFFGNVFNNIRLRPMPLPGPGSRVMIFVPHPDDETAGCGLLISRLVQNGCQVKVVLTTYGDGVGKADRLVHSLTKPGPEHFLRQAGTRRAESLKALRRLGVAGRDVIFLGYPDGGSIYLWSTHWNGDKPFTSPYSKRNYVFYPGSFTPGSPFTGAAMVGDFEKALRRFRPTHVVYPHFYDSHPDHFVTNNFVKYAIARLDYQAVEYIYLVHRGNWPSPPGRFKGQRLRPPKALGTEDLIWYSLEGTASELAAKERALSAYRSQNRNWLMKVYLDSFLRQNELYAEYHDFEMEREAGEIYPEGHIEFVNPFSDVYLGYVNRPADIRGLELTIENGIVTCRLSTIKRPHREYRYLLGLIFFGPGTATRRVIFTVEREQLVYQPMTSDSLARPERSQCAIGGNYLEISFPLDGLPRFRSILVSASTYQNWRLIDRTGTRLIRVRDEE